MQTLKTLLESPAVNVFFGTLLLLLTLAWGLLSSERRLGRIKTKLNSIEGRLSNVRERLVKVETKLEGGHVVLAR